MRTALLFLMTAFVATAGCIGTRTQRCSWGEICPTGRYCDAQFELCLFPGQVEACADASELDTCSFVGAPVGSYQCSGGLCLPSFCGDGFTGPGEQCDDGNQVGGDGCSANCRSDEECGNGVVDVPLGESCDDGNLGSHDGCSSGCQPESAGWRNGGAALGSRYGVFGAFDAARGRVVLFGGVDAESHPTDETWEHDGEGWVQRILASQPSGRMDHSLTYDTERQTMVLHAGWTGLDALNDTWEYSGFDWTRVTTSSAPSLRSAHATAYDAQRQRVVLFGGEDAARVCFADTWLYDGVDWALLTTTATPERRRYTDLVYDKQRQVTVMFGGSYDPTNWVFLNDTWELDGTDWVQVNTANAPPARHGHRMVYDSVNQRVLLFGGMNPGGVMYHDLWAYDGVDWVELNVGASPPGRLQFLLAHDSGEGRTLLFGGNGVGSNYLNDTWLLEGDAWREVTMRAPKPRAGHVVAYHAGQQRLVLFGGYDDYTYQPNSFALTAETWIYANRSWTQLATTQQPAPRTFAAMTAAPSLGALVLFGGASGADILTLQGDTWLFDGQTWIPLTLPVSPSPRAAAGLAHHAPTGRVVLFGGTDWMSPYEDTWTFDGYDWTELTGLASSPPPRYAHAMAYDATLERIVLFGGDTGTGVSADTWLFDGQQWLAADPAVSPPARKYATLAFHAHRGRVLLYGGEGTLGAFNDTWEYDGTTWQQITMPADEIRQLARAAAGYVPQERSIVLFGGTGSGFNLWGETWRYRFVSEWPDEDCATTVDEDGDGLVGCDDPDCPGHLCGGGRTCTNTETGTGTGVCE